MLFDYAVYNLMHLLLAGGVMRFVQNGLFLRFGHSRIGVERTGVQCQCHTEANGYFVKIHVFLPLPCCIQHILHKDTVSPNGIIHQNMRHHTNKLPVLNNRSTAHRYWYLGQPFDIFCVYDILNSAVIL